MAWWKHCTKTGRVVYDRPRNPITWCAVRRIARAVVDPWTLLQTWCRASAAKLIVRELLAGESMGRFELYEEYVGPVDGDLAGRWLIRALEQWRLDFEEKFPGFGGGEFGGAGASREF